MGGFGSGSHWAGRSKCTVDQSLSLDVNWMTREGIFDGIVLRSGLITWSNPYHGESSIGYQVNTYQRRMRLQYRFPKSGESIDYEIPLTTTRLPWGGHRWWFNCPLIVNGQKCGRRVGMLYLSPRGKYFGCRHCLDLTYESCQESHRYDKLFVGFDLRDVVTYRQLEERINRQDKRNEQRRQRRKALNWS